MWSFLIRFVLFIGLFSLIVLNTTSHQAFSLLMLTASLTCFFLISQKRATFLLFLILSCSIMVHSFILKEHVFTALLLLFISTMAMQRFHSKVFSFFLILHSVFILNMVWLNGANLLPWTLIVLACTIFLIQLGQKTEKEREQQILYENVVAEFRQLKRMHVSREEIAKAEERSRIAREIHDSVGHQLTGLMMKIEMLHIEKPDRNLLELKQMANASLQETREAVQALQTSEVTGIHAIVHLIRTLEAESQLMIEFTIKEGVLSISLSNEEGIVLYRVVQEALTNVMRHSHSKLVQIELGKAAIDALTFSVMNPLTTKQPFTKGFGIQTMQERMNEIGGRLDVYQTEEQFVVNGMVPFNKEGNPDVANPGSR